MSVLNPSSSKRNARYIKKGYVWAANRRPAGGYSPIREAGIWETILWWLFRSEPSP